MLLNIHLYFLLKISQKSKPLINLEQNLKEKNIEILVETDSKTWTKEILATLQLILCYSSSLPLHIIGDTFESMLLIINSTEKIAASWESNYIKIFLDDEKLEIGELVKSICLAVLNWEFKQSDDHYSVKKHQEEFILIKNQEVWVYSQHFR